MKIRTGFVSNSSSSSFLVVGKRIRYDPEEITKKIAQEGVRMAEDAFDREPEDYLEALGLKSKPDDNDFQVIISRDYENEIIVGFGRDNYSEYDHNETPIAEVQRLTAKAAEYFGTMNIQLLHGIVDPGH